jgi:hypothetical protein
VARKGNGTSDFIRSSVADSAAGFAQYSFHIFYQNASTPGTSTVSKPVTISDSTSTFDVSFCWHHTSNPKTLFHRKSGGVYNQVTISTSLSANTWYGIGGSFDGTNLVVFLNGSSSASTASSAPPNTPNPMCVLLAGSGGTGNFDAGIVAEAAFWTTGLTTSEWAALGNGVSPLMIRPQSLLRYWPLIGDISAHWGGGISSSGTSVQPHVRMYYPTNSSPEPLPPTAGPTWLPTRAQPLPPEPEPAQVRVKPWLALVNPQTADFTWYRRLPLEAGPGPGPETVRVTPLPWLTTAGPQVGDFSWYAARTSEAKAEPRPSELPRVGWSAFLSPQQPANDFTWFHRNITALPAERSPPRPTYKPWLAPLWPQQPPPPDLGPWAPGGTRGMALVVPRDPTPEPRLRRFTEIVARMMNSLVQNGQLIQDGDFFRLALPAALAGFAVVQVGSGPPTGSPADGAVYLDVTNSKFYARIAGAWKSASLS